MADPALRAPDETGVTAWFVRNPVAANLLMILIIVLGALTAVGALLYAVVDEDLKRVLAYSTVENVGIIYVALGLALAFKATGLDAAAAVSMTAALLHVIFHSWYKMLLFLGAGAVLHSTGRRDFSGLGGLIHRMPRTALLFLVGALAISALPPLNGFVSEWLLFQAVLAGPGFPEPVLRFLIPAVGGLLALAAALAAACFVRVYGIIFLGRPRSGEAAAAHEVPLAQWGAMALLAGLCIAGGLFAAPLIDILKPLTTALVGAALPGSGTGPTPSVPGSFPPCPGSTTTRRLLLGRLSVMLCQRAVRTTNRIHRHSVRAARPTMMLRFR